MLNLRRLLLQTDRRASPQLKMLLTRLAIRLVLLLILIRFQVPPLPDLPDLQMLQLVTRQVQHQLLM